MVVAQKMQKTVGQEVSHLVNQRAAACAGLS